MEKAKHADNQMQARCRRVRLSKTFAPHPRVWQSRSAIARPARQLKAEQLSPVTTSALVNLSGSVHTAAREHDQCARRRESVFTRLVQLEPKSGRAGVHACRRQQRLSEARITGMVLVPMALWEHHLSAQRSRRRCVVAGRRAAQSSVAVERPLPAAVCIALACRICLSTFLVVAQQRHQQHHQRHQVASSQTRSLAHLVGCHLQIHK